MSARPRQPAAEYLDRSTEYADPRVASALDELSLWSSRFGAVLLEHLPLGRDLAVLDLGCGAGFPLFELAHMLGPSCRMVGADLWHAALARAEGKRRLHELGNVLLVRADGARLPLPEASFDLVVSNLGINNFADPAATLAECARVIRPGGRIALTTNPRGHMAELYEVFREVLARLGSPGSLERLAVNEDHRGTREDLTALLDGAGFRVERVVEDRFQMRYLDGAALLRHSLTRFGFLDGWRSAVDPADERAAFAELEARLDEIAREEGELRMTVPRLYLQGRRRQRW
jgi:arsenite methyltransferase